MCPRRAEAAEAVEAEEVLVMGAVAVEEVESRGPGSESGKALRPQPGRGLAKVSAKARA
jgi:hypothetical protein